MCFGLSLDNALEGLKTSQMRCFNMFDLVGIDPTLGGFIVGIIALIILLKIL